MDNFITVMSNFKGEFAALAAALFWSISSVLFKNLGKSIRPVELNLLKGILATVLLIGTSLIIGETLSVLAPVVILLLAVSGALGIGFGDTMYFKALNTLGPRLTLLIGILAPPLTAIFATIFLKENLTLVSWVGILITIVGVAWVITEKPSNGINAPGKLWLGILFGFLAAFSQASGAVISRWALTQTEVSALQSAIIRLIAGTLFLFLWMIFRKQKIGQWIKPDSSRKLLGTILTVVFIGTYLAIWLQQISFQFTNVGIAQTLLATSPLFILPIAALQGEKVSLRAVIGVLISTAGVALLFLVG